MRRLGLLLGLLLVVLQNLVFWQSLLPQAELGQQVCAQISRALQSPANPLSQYQQGAVPQHTDHVLHAEHNPPQHHADSNIQHTDVPHSHLLDPSQQAHEQHSQSTGDCHFCQLFHSLLPLFKPHCRLQLARIQIRFSLAAILLDLLLYLKQLFLSPPSRAPPLFPSLA